MLEVTALPVINAGISFSQMNCEEETVFEVVKSMTRMVMTWSVKQLDSVAE